jgi:CubicO group peptidase (beta-lactamase class C family)
LDQLARDLFAHKKVALAVVTGVSARSNGGWTTAIGAAGRLAMGVREPLVTPDTWFDLASVTKPLTALAAARLVRAGKLDLSAPLGQLLPEAVGTPTERAPLELLLAHRAGLEPHIPLYRGLLQGRSTSREDRLVQAASARASDAIGPVTGEGFPPRYSDLGYLLVGEALERVCDEPLDRIIEREVTAPLSAEIGSARRIRARDATFARRVAATEVVPWRGGTVRGLVHDENAWCHSGEGTSGHAGLFGTAAGVLAVGRAVVDVLHGRLDGFLRRDELWPHVRPRPSGTLRAGFDGKSESGSSSGEKFGKSTIGHLGFTGTSLWCDVDREVVGVLLTNRVHPTRDNDVIRKVRPEAYDRMAEWAQERGIW